MSEEDSIFEETLQEARDRLKENLRDGIICPCCGQLAKIYKRKLNSGMARSLINFYKRSLEKPGWFHALKDFQFETQGSKYICGDYSKLAFWGLIEEGGDTKDDGNPNAGFYRITKLGVDFVLGKIPVNRYVYLFNGNQVHVEDEDQQEIKIHEALADGFNYDELMAS